MNELFEKLSDALIKKQQLQKLNNINKLVIASFFLSVINIILLILVFAVNDNNIRLDLTVAFAIFLCLWYLIQIFICVSVYKNKDNQFVNKTIVWLSFLSLIPIIAFLFLAYLEFVILKIKNQNIELLKNNP